MNCNNLEGFWYQKQCFGLLAHPVHCYIGLIGVKSITFSGNTLLPTSFVVFDLQGTNNGVTGYLHFQQIGLFSYPIHCCMGLFGIESITLLEADCLQLVLWFPCSKKKGKWRYRLFALSSNWKVFLTVFVHCCIELLLTTSK